MLRLFALLARHHLLGVALERTPPRQGFVQHRADDVPVAAARVELVQRNQVGMDDVRERAKFALEPEQIAAGGGLEQLERDLALQVLVERSIDEARAAGAERAADLEPTRERGARFG